ncbi:hypothetical protein [Neptunicella marina]|uniref:Tetratricopeptide repeat-containing protein n=1 Tax=Neptunicella marina TaxID=2125989 RepID=A0A8J6M2V0_9ALTE|nr:hypothetical protein [Neptunicella marina]MBC3764796.1 hypothetical protein [Neptunicella marina]
MGCINKLIKALVAVVGLVVCAAGNAKNVEQNAVLTEQVNAAFHYLVQGDTSLAARLLAEQNKSKQQNPELSKLDIMLQIELEDTDAAERRLLTFETRFAHNPDTFAFAADAWRDIGHQASIFSKFGFYKKGVKAKLRAGEVAPNSAEYVALRAGASAHGSSYGADDSLQKPLTDKAIELDKKWGYVARLNYAQNTDDQQLGVTAAQQAVEDFPADFVVLERVAQYYWTIDDISSSQQHFFRACENRPQQKWYREIKWINACYQVAVFSQKQQLLPKSGVQALNLLLKTYRLPTKQNLDIAELLLDIAGGQNSELAVQRLRDIVKLGKDSALFKRAQKRLVRELKR